MSIQGKLHRLSAFSSDPEGGNPAGVWIGEAMPADDEMLRIAAELGYSETAFLAPGSGRQRTIRYFSPKAEVSFCGHATIASGVLLGELEGEGSFVLDSQVGPITVDVQRDGASLRAALHSVEPKQKPLPEGLLERALAALHWRPGDLDPQLSPALAYGGAWHLVLALRSLSTLQALDYDYDALEALMHEHGLTTLQLIHRESAELFHARDPFPVGGVVEDPATGAAAAALGGYLRDQGHLIAPACFTIRQGEAMGRPSLLRVDVPVRGGITVSGFAVSLPDPEA